MAGRTLDSFLQANDITREEWDASGADWAELDAIAADHDGRNQALCNAAEFIAGRIRTFPGVHSVRWRVKDTDHLLAKIIRKKLEPDENPKYANIDRNNYSEIVTDLIGVRALHLFKDDCIAIDQSIRETWTVTESMIYTRKGDAVPEALVQLGSQAKDHPKGYRSVHYIIECQPERRKIAIEVQVRTLFEEGWSEIDHKVRYPNFSDNESVAFFLTIFNRLAGSADEMGSFVKELTHVLQTVESDRAQAVSQRDQALEEMETVLGELQMLRQQDEQSQALISKLKDDMHHLRTVSRATNHAKPKRRIDSLLGGSSEYDESKARALGIGLDLITGSVIPVATRRGVITRQRPTRVKPNDPSPED